MYKIIIALLVCFNLSAQSFVVMAPWTLGLIEEYYAGEWNEFLEENEADYEEYIAQNDLQKKINAIDHCDKILMDHFDLYMERQQEIEKLMADLDVVCKKQGINLEAMLMNGGAKNDSILLNMLCEMKSNCWIFSFMSPMGIPKLQQLEFGKKVKDLELLVSSALEKELDIIADRLRPILVEYTVKSYLADCKQSGLAAQSILENDELDKLLMAVGPGSFVDDCCSPLAPLTPESDWDDDDEEDEVTNYEIEAQDMFISIFNNVFSMLNIHKSMERNFGYFLELSEGKREPENALEEACLPVFIKHKKTLSGEWSERLKKLKYCYLEL